MSQTLDAVKTLAVSIFALWDDPQRQPERADSFGNPALELVPELVNLYGEVPDWNPNYPAGVVEATDAEYDGIVAAIRHRLEAWLISSAEFAMSVDGKVKGKLADVARWAYPQIFDEKGICKIKKFLLAERCGHRRTSGILPWAYSHMVTHQLKEPFKAYVTIEARRPALEALAARVVDNLMPGQRKYTELDMCVMACCFLKEDATFSDTYIKNSLRQNDHFRSAILPFVRVHHLYPDLRLLERGYAPYDSKIGYQPGGAFPKSALKGDFWNALRGSMPKGKGSKLHFAVAKVFGTDTPSGRVATSEEVEAAIKIFMEEENPKKRMMGQESVKKLSQATPNSSLRGLLDAIHDDESGVATKTLDTISKNLSEIETLRQRVATLEAENSKLRQRVEELETSTKKQTRKVS